MKNIAPDIFRQRLLIEAYYPGEVDSEKVRLYLLGVAAHLDLRTYADPIVFSPAGLGRTENQGFDGFVPLIDSGIAAYFWTGPRFLSVLLYTCRGFDPDAALSFTRQFFNIQGELVSTAI
jgi:hypothetical protein